MVRTPSQPPPQDKTPQTDKTQRPLKEDMTACLLRLAALNSKLNSKCGVLILPLGLKNEVFHKSLSSIREHYVFQMKGHFVFFSRHFVRGVLTSYLLEYRYDTWDEEESSGYLHVWTTKHPATAKLNGILFNSLAALRQPLKFVALFISMLSQQAR